MDLLLAVLIPVAIFGIIYWQKSRLSRSLQKGLIPGFLLMSQDSLIQVYISAGALVMLRQRQDTHQKVAFMYKYLLNTLVADKNLIHVAGFYTEVRQKLQEAIKYPVRIDSLCAWLLDNRFTRSQKLGMLTFLIRLAFVDGETHPEEIRIIRQIAAGLQIKDTELDELIRPFREIQEARAREEQEAHVRSRQHTILHTRIRLDKYYALLEIPAGAALAEIKRAYRKLAMQFHPDRMVNADEATFESAQDKFIAIQQAYEVLCAATDINS
jgi:DnaJ-domain-containing protein 1